MKIHFTMLAGVIAAVASLGFAGRAANADDYNAANQFSLAHNPNGTWSYGYIPG
jgi:hypothetical protein